MASLKTLIGGGEISKPSLSFFVYSTDYTSVNNGGRCCCIVIPTGYCRAEVELWGGGANGGGSCCCQWPYCVATPGHYVQSKFDVASGEFYTVCAGSSTGCAQICCGCCGFPTYVLRNGSSTCACAQGGCNGFNNCFYWGNSCYGICSPGYRAGSTLIGCLCQCAHRGISRTGACGADMHEITVGTAKIGQNLHGSNPCVHSYASYGCTHYPTAWPAGPGAGAGACGGGCCWSSWGAGGLAIIRLYS